MLHTTIIYQLVYAGYFEHPANLSLVVEIGCNVVKGTNLSEAKK